ncbi:hypothetical protein SCHPADRAFT_904458 [Schizopora paradoxa]|uniref:DNA breaking-rejoining enzyme n=1 Tax=Schizopora paradoxa TaxID=27342 RepID=A0A0H2S8F2_9AGAM|nr:hypothetical protein SCHPADRAFT_904458 [Schizopora paradoxa]
MPKDRRSRSTRGKAKAAVGPASAMATLQKTRDDTVSQHRHAPTTRASYNGYVARARAFLAVYCKGDGSDELANQQSESQPSDVDVPADKPWLDPLFKHAFDDTPNKYSPEAVELFITHKCVNEGCKKSTADSICAALKKLWEESNKDGLYREAWFYDETRKQCRGNPVESPRVQDLVKSLRNMYAADGGERNHSLAMKFPILEKIRRWSESRCPVSSVEERIEDASMSERELRTEVLMRNTYFSLAFTLWTRNEELANLKYQDITFNCEGPEPYHEPCFRVHLANRKGWQRKLDATQHSSSRHEYDQDRGIYDQPATPAMNAYVDVKLWVRYLEVNHYGRKLQGDDYIFPAIGCNGVYKPGEHISHDAVQKMIDKAVDGANITRPSGGVFSTHCFRRGGAQYRFMYAPPAERWTLARIKWWGGWSVNESRDTIIRYLLDELQFMEESHADALSAVAPSYSASLMGVQSEREPVTRGEMRVMCHTLQNQFCGGLDGIRNSMSNLTNVFSTAIAAASDRLRISPGYPTPFSHGTSGMPEISSMPVAATATSVGCSPWEHQHGYQTTNSFASSYPPIPLQQVGSSRWLSPPAYGSHSAATAGSDAPLGLNLQYPLPGIPSLAASFPTWTSATTPIAPIATSETDSNSRSALSSLPPPGLSIPDIRIKDKALELVISHWQHPNPSCGLIVALKDWPVEWYSGANKDKFAMKRYTRQVVALEYLEVYKSDDARFKRDYPEWNKGFTKLHKAVNAKREARGEREHRSRQR